MGGKGGGSKSCRRLCQCSARKGGRVADGTQVRGATWQRRVPATYRTSAFVRHLEPWQIASFAKSNCKQPTNRINGLQSFFVQLLMNTSVRGAPQEDRQKTRVAQCFTRQAGNCNLPASAFFQGETGPTVRYRACEIDYGGIETAQIFQGFFIFENGIKQFLNSHIRRPVHRSAPMRCASGAVQRRARMSISGESAIARSFPAGHTILEPRLSNSPRRGMTVRAPVGTNLPGDMGSGPDGPRG